MMEVSKCSIGDYKYFYYWADPERAKARGLEAFGDLLDKVKGLKELVNEMEELLKGRNFEFKSFRGQFLVGEEKLYLEADLGGKIKGP